MSGVWWFGFLLVVLFGCLVGLLGNVAEKDGISLIGKIVKRGFIYF